MAGIEGEVDVAEEGREFVVIDSDTVTSEIFLEESLETGYGFVFNNNCPVVLAISEFVGVNGYCIDALTVLFGGKNDDIFSIVDVGKFNVSLSNCRKGEVELIVGIVGSGSAHCQCVSICGLGNGLLYALCVVAIELATGEEVEFHIGCGDIFVGVACYNSSTGCRGFALGVDGYGLDDCRCEEIGLVETVGDFNETEACELAFSVEFRRYHH